MERCTFGTCSGGVYGYNIAAHRKYLAACHNVEVSEDQIESYGKRLGYQADRESVGHELILNRPEDIMGGARATHTEIPYRSTEDVCGPGR